VATTHPLFICKLFLTSTRLTASFQGQPG